jgi:hypothetical protein
VHFTRAQVRLLLHVGVAAMKSRMLLLDYQLLMLDVIRLTNVLSDLLLLWRGLRLLALLVMDLQLVDDLREQGLPRKKMSFRVSSRRALRATTREVCTQTV